MIVGAKCCTRQASRKAFAESQGNICWQMYPEGPTIESMAVTRTKHQVSVNMKPGSECFLKFNPSRTKAPSTKENDSRHQIITGKAKAKQQSIFDSRAW